MRKKNQVVKVRAGLKVKPGTKAIFTFADYPDRKAEFTMTGIYKDVKKIALEHYNAVNSSNFMTIELIDMQPLEGQMEIEFDNKSAIARRELAKIKKMFNKNK